MLSITRREPDSVNDIPFRIGPVTLPMKKSVW